MLPLWERPAWPHTPVQMYLAGPLPGGYLPRAASSAMRGSGERGTWRAPAASTKNDRVLTQDNCQVARKPVCCRASRPPASSR